MPSNAVPTFTTNAHEVSAKLGRIGDKVENPRDLLVRIRRILTQQELDVFASEGAALDGVWNALVQPERKTGGSHILVGTGAMMESVAGPTAGTIRNNTTLRIHPKPFYSRWHQFGTTKMDARPFTGISDATYRLIMREFERATGEDLGA
jgi:phage gpG-like protein